VVGGRWSVVGDCSYAALRKNTRTDKVQGAGSKVEGYEVLREKGRRKEKGPGWSAGPFLDLFLMGAGALRVEKF